MTYLERFFAALYLSEGWYDGFVRTGRIHNRARAVVLFDRAVTGRMK